MVHLHVHSNFSFLDGASPPERLLARAAELHMPALALTDHHGLYGIVRFLQAAKTHHIKPIIGAELQVQSQVQRSKFKVQRVDVQPSNDVVQRSTFNVQRPGARNAERRTQNAERETRNQEPGTHHLLLLAESRQGYANLCRIITKAQLDHQDDPQITLEDLAPLTGGLIALSGCRRGEVAAALESGESKRALERAVQVARRYAAIFGPDNFWIELQHHRLPGDDARTGQLIEVARRARLGYVITNNVHYARPDEYRLRDVMACIQTNTPLDVWTDIRQRNAEYYLKSREELRTAFASFPDAVVEVGLDASIYLASRCDLEGRERTQRARKRGTTSATPHLDTSSGVYNTAQGVYNTPLLATAMRPPEVEVPAGETAFSYLYKLCQKGLQERYRPVRPEVVKQLAYELSVVEHMELAPFFLCVWDIVRFAREQGIRCAGRGSAADSIIAYVLGITTVDPIAHNLLFERFVNPGRVGMPDVDIDFDSRRRDEVIAYIEDKYGTEHAAMVANVITYRARSAFRDVAKAMGYPPPLIDRIAAALSYRSTKHIREDLVPSSKFQVPNPDVQRDGEDGDARTADRGTQNAEFGTRNEERGTGASELRTQNPELETIVSLCEQLDGYPRHLSLHNGGMLITREPLVDVVPLEYATSGVRVCQFNKDDVEALGLIKFDILGLRTLSIVDEAAALIKETHDVDLPVDDLPLDDKRTFDLICSSETIGVFQIESPGQWHLLQRAQPRTFSDLIIQIALFRPGPLQGGMVNPYIERRAGRAPIAYPHPCLEAVLRDTMGVVIFQEQVLQVAHDFAGLSYADADGLRRAISHYRTEAEMEVCRTAFVESAVRMGRDRALAEDMYHKITYFSGYGFCRSHAAAFAKIVYQTAYLKAHYPAEFLAAILSNEPCCYYPAQTVIEEARKLGITVLPVDINRSRARYHVEMTFNVQRSTFNTEHRTQNAERRTQNPIPRSTQNSGLKTQNPIRMGLMQVKGVSEETAEAIVAAREGRPYRHLADFCRRTSLDRDAIQNLIAVGAFDSLGVPRRQLLWQLDDQVQRVQSSEFKVQSIRAHQPGSGAQPMGMSRLIDEQINSSLEALNFEPGTLNLEPMSELDLAGLDFTLQDASAEYSIMSFYRRSLRAARISSIGELRGLPHGLVVKAAGVVISRQRPPTAKGMTFLVLSDEEGELPVAIYPTIFERNRWVINSSVAMVIEGTLQRTGRHVSMLAKRVWRLQDVATLDTQPYRPPGRQHAATSA